MSAEMEERDDRIKLGPRPNLTRAERIELRAEAARLVREGLKELESSKTRLDEKQDEAKA